LRLDTARRVCRSASGTSPVFHMNEGELAAGGGSAEAAGSRPVYSIGAVVKMLGIDAASLRAWEERYGLVVPERSRGGQRIYSRDDLARLRFVIERMADGSGPGDAHRLLGEQLRAPGGATGPKPEGPEIVILLAERDRYAAELAEYLLRTEGYDVCVVFDPEKAERYLAERHFHLAVVELMLSGGGLGVCRELARTPGMPVLALSALDLADEALAAGAGAFVPKPINPLQLISTVRDLLGRSALTHPPRQRVSQ
jgi:DNA-binding transcriptional MerR regulator